MGPSVLSEKKGPYHGSIRRVTPTPPSSSKARRHPKRPSITSTLHTTTRQSFVCSSQRPGCYCRGRMLWRLLAAALVFVVMQQMLSFRWLRDLFGFGDQQQPAATPTYPSQVFSPGAGWDRDVSTDDGDGGLWRGDGVGRSEFGNMDVTELVTTGILTTKTVRTSEDSPLLFIVVLTWLYHMKAIARSLPCGHALTRLVYASASWVDEGSAGHVLVRK